MTISAAYVPVITVRKRLDFAGDYLTRRSKTAGRIGETVDTLDQRVELNLGNSGLKSCVRMQPTSAAVFVDQVQCLRG